MKSEVLEDTTRKLGNLNTDIFVETFGELQTDEVIVTEERVEHILKQHPNDYDLFLEYADGAVANPDIIIKDCKHVGTVFLIKRLENSNINVVIRLALSTDKSELKNSVMTFFRLREGNLQKMIKKNELLYKNE